MRDRAELRNWSDVLLEVARWKRTVDGVTERGVRSEPGEKAGQKIGLDFPLKGHIMGFKELGQLGVYPDRPECLPFFGPRLFRFHPSLNPVLGDGHLLHLVLVQQIQKPAVRNGFDGQDLAQVTLDEQNGPYRQQDIPDGKFVMFFHVSSQDVIEC